MSRPVAPSHTSTGQLLLSHDKEEMSKVDYSSLIRTSQFLIFWKTLKSGLFTFCISRCHRVRLLLHSSDILLMCRISRAVILSSFPWGFPPVSHVSCNTPTHTKCKQPPQHTPTYIQFALLHFLEQLHCHLLASGLLWNGLWECFCAKCLLSVLFPPL